METHSSFLCQIADLKHHLDQINEEIEVYIGKSRDIDSKMLQCTKKEKTGLKEEEKWKLDFILNENRFKDLKVLSDAIKCCIMESIEGMQLLEVKRDEFFSKITEEREKFMDYCELFRKNLSSSEISSERTYLLRTKKELLESLDFLNQGIGTVEVSTWFLVEEMNNCIKRLRHKNEDLRSSIQQRTFENEKILEEIGRLNKTLKDLQTHEDIFWEVHMYNDEKRQLQDFIQGLQLQLPRLEDEEKRLEAVCLERQQVLREMEEA